MSKLRAWLLRQAFNPGLAGILVNPFYLARRGLFDSLLACGSRVRGRVLDVGCGQKPYMSLFHATEYVGVEIDTPENRRQKRADFYYDGRTLPFDDEAFDAVLCSQVLEHVFEPDLFLDELRRVLRPGGTLLLTTPFVWDEHEQPFDYARYSSFGLKYVVEKHGFLLEEAHKTLANVSVLFQLANAYLFKVTRTRFRVANLACTALFMAPVTVLGIIASVILPKNPDLYLDNVMLLRKRD